MAPLVWSFGDGRRIVVPEHIFTDLASVLRLPLIYLIWGNRAHREAVLHDYCYRKDAFVILPDGSLKGITREDADWYFRMAMISSSPEVNKQAQPYYIYQPMYLAVRAFAKKHYHRMNVFDEFTLDEAA